MQHPIEHPVSLHLPPPAELERRARIVALLDTLLEPDVALRYFDFHPTWDEGERVLSIRSGEGDHAFLWFGSAGALVRGRHRDAEAVPDDALFHALPSALHRVRHEPAFQVGGDSFAVWWSAPERAWHGSVDPRRGRLDEVLSALGGTPASFAAYAEPYHARTLDRTALDALFEGGRVSATWLGQLGVRPPLKQAFALARALGFEVVRPPGRRERESVAKSKSKAGLDAPSTAPLEEDETLGEAEFKVIRVGDETRLVVAGKVRLRADRPGLYMELLESVRAALRAASS